MVGFKENYYVYQITNLINNMIYIGVRSCNCIPKEDTNYWSSSKILINDIKTLGKQNFKKEILFIYKDKQESLNKEEELVNKEFVMRTDTYNRMIGGKGFSSIDMVHVKDKEGNNLLIFKDDSRWLNGEVIHNTKGTICVKDKTGKSFRVDKNDRRWLDGTLIPICKNQVTVKDKDGKTCNVYKDDPRYINGELVPILKGKRIVKDKDGKTFQVDKEDPRWLSGELVSISKGRIGIKGFLDKTHSVSSIKKMKKTHGKNKFQQGNKNSQFGTCWITNNLENKKIKKEDLEKYLTTGWKPGRIILVGNSKP